MNANLRMRVYRTTHLLHWISAAVCFAALMLFTITGITLNHASSISGKPVVTQREAQLPRPLMGFPFSSRELALLVCAASLCRSSRLEAI